MIDDGEKETGMKAPHQLEPYTIYEISILKAYKGEIKEGKTVKLMLMGGETEDSIYITPEQEISLKKDGEYLFLLGEQEGFPAYVLNPTQSVFNLKTPENYSGEITIDSIMNAISKGVE